MQTDMIYWLSLTFLRVNRSTPIPWVFHIELPLSQWPLTLCRFFSNFSRKHSDIFGVEEHESGLSFILELVIKILDGRFPCVFIWFLTLLWKVSLGKNEIKITQNIVEYLSLKCYQGMIRIGELKCLQSTQANRNILSTMSKLGFARKK